MPAKSCLIQKQQTSTNCKIRSLCAGFIYLSQDSRDIDFCSWLITRLCNEYNQIKSKIYSLLEICRKHSNMSLLLQTRSPLIASQMIGRSSHRKKLFKMYMGPLLQLKLLLGTRVKASGIFCKLVWTVYVVIRVAHHGSWPVPHRAAMDRTLGLWPFHCCK